MPSIADIDGFVARTAKDRAFIEVDIAFYDELKVLLRQAKREAINDMLGVHDKVYGKREIGHEWYYQSSVVIQKHLGLGADMPQLKPEYKQPKIFGKDEDGFYKGQIEQIGLSRLFKQSDMLMISNRKPNAWIFNPFTGYRQIGTFHTEPNKFKEGDMVIVEKKDGEIINIMRDI